ncbi:hypothetical protein [Methylobacter psychrophilus]|uniref:hypothetical protein n=1 Tax=Methylobacter psychrophilus TaxID=96941 RepID=UPI00374E16EA
MLRGKANYFQVGRINRAYCALNNYTVARLCQLLRNKSKVRRVEAIHLRTVTRPWILCAAWPPWCVT